MIVLGLALVFQTPSAEVIEARVAKLVSQLTLEEKVSLCHGATDFTTKAIPRLGIPEFKFDDGPQGVRGPKATYFPTGVSIASTWNPSLAYEMGIGLGADSRANGIACILGPAINMVRTPLGGRSFEYMSEDPYLAGELAANYIQGVQSQGVAACAKHYAANSQETQRLDINAQVGERALHEIYLPAFKAAVQKGGALTLMAAYNKVNGFWCTENDILQNQILKRDWGFRGAIMSDWGATHHTVEPANFGLDLEMPGSGPNDFFGDPLLAAVKSGKVKEATVNDKVTRLLRAMFTATTRTPEVPRPANDPRTQATARRIAEQSITLLKNTNNALPLDRTKLKSIAVIGPASDVAHGGSGGSSSVYPPYEVTPLQGIRKLVGDKVKVSYLRGTGYGDDAMPIVPSTVLSKVQGEFFANTKFEGTPKVSTADKIDFRWNKQGPVEGVGGEYFTARFTTTLTAKKSGVYDLGVSSDDGTRLYVNDRLFVDNWGDHAVETKTSKISLEAGQSVKLRVDYYQGYGEAICRLVWREPGENVNKEIEDAAALAKASDVAIVCVGTNHHWDTEGLDKPNMQLMGEQAKLVSRVREANPNTIVVLVNGSPVDVRPWASNVPAILEMWYAGMEGGTALASILFGDVNPSGKLPVSFPVALEDSPAHANGNFPGDKVILRYDEGNLIGYRWFDTKHIAPAFPFGHGLSYSTFAYDRLSIARNGAMNFDLKFRLTNKSAVAGAEVAQVYVHAVQSSGQPDRELRAFKKVYVSGGKDAEVAMNLDRNAFAYWDTATHGWKVEAGDYDVLVGSSSRDIRLTKRVHIEKSVTWKDSER